ncbi:MAG TPA: response regulator transcription factor [Planctomycetaceae bacterium]|jgi:DNA-binding response OmpR family regulator
MRILLVEDFSVLRESIALGLREAGFAVDEAAEGETGLWYATTSDYDVIILDLMLPRLDGLSVLKRLRAAGKQAHVLILTARDAPADRVDGLDRGADDYLVKPFVFAELLARVRALVRRRYDLKSPLIAVADMQIDTTTRTVRRDGQVVELTGREYALLEFLALRAGQVVSRTEIWEHVYEFESEAESNVVDAFIRLLRKKIERPHLPPLIHTRRGHGYLLGNIS